MTQAGRTIKSVKLFYSTSKDAAPFEVSMEETGGGSYLGSVPQNVLVGLNQITYYIAAENDAGATAETHWYTISLTAPQPGGAGTAAAAAEPPRAKWVMPALIAGGVAVVAGAVVLATSSKSGGGGGGGSTAPTNFVGTYRGTDQEWAGAPGSNPVYTTHSATITIAKDGTVSSADLHTGSTLTAKLSGADFVLTAPIVQSDLNGEIRYIGTVVNSRIVGTVEGSATSATNTLQYSGAFNATKQ